MRVPDQAPALLRNSRGLARPFGRRWVEADGVRPSQLDGDEDAETADEGGESGEETSDDGDASMESE